MNKNIACINAGLRSLTHKPNEIICGTVVSGSIDTTALTISVAPADDGQPIEGVRLHSINNNQSGIIVFPAAGSNVVIGSINGPGEWVLLQTSEITKVKITIGEVVCEMDNANFKIQNHSVILNMSDSLIKMATASENLFALLKDLLDTLAILTVPTPAGTSGVPINAADFNALRTRLSNLLTN